MLSTEVLGSATEGRWENLHQTLGKKQLEDVYAMLDLDMSLPEAATRISDESYWKRRTQAKHRNAQVEKHGMSWKQTFLELELQDALERVPITVEYGNPELEALKQQVYASRLHVFQLAISQFPSHIDLSFLFDNLPALCSFAITYGNRRLGMDYERAMFGMKISDAQYLARNVRVSQTLVSLALPCNMIDDELVKVLMGGLSYGHMLTHLDLSHNKIGDRGARRLASLLDPDYALQTLDLSDNQIHANGCMHLGAHLAENVTCQVLNLRLNRCEDNGVSHLFQDLCVNKYLKTLNISCNDLTVRSLPYMNSMLAENVTIAELDVSANLLYQADMEEVLARLRFPHFLEHVFWPAHLAYGQPQAPVQEIEVADGQQEYPVPDTMLRLTPRRPHGKRHRCRPRTYGYLCPSQGTTAGSMQPTGR